MKKLVTYFALFLVVLFALMACDNDNNDSEITEITFMNFNATPNHEDVLMEMVEIFEYENPDIRVNVEMVPFGDYFTRLQTLIAGGNAPDVFELNFENFVDFASRGSLVDLNRFIEEDENFDPSTLNQSAFEAYNIDGRQYGMAAAFSNVLTFYNEDLFDAAGLTHPAGDWTWDDIRAAATQLTDPESRVWGFSAPVTMNEFFKVAAQNGGEIVDVDGNVIINSPQNVEALTWMVDNILVYGISPSPADLTGQEPGDLFMNGQIAMLNTGIWMFNAFSDAPFAWNIQLEAGNDRQAHHFFANGLAISVDSEAQEAAYRFVAFMVSERVAEIRIEHSWELPIIDDEDILAPYLELDMPASRHVVFEAMDSLVMPPAVHSWSQIQDVTNQEFERVLLGQITPQEALDFLQGELEAILSE